MAKLLEGGIAKTIGKAMVKAGLTIPLTLIKVTPGTRTPGAVSAGTNPTEVSFKARGIEAEYSAYAIANSLVEVGDRKIRIFSSTIAGGQIPTQNDKVIARGFTYRIVGPVTSDAARASYVCQCRR